MGATGDWLSRKLDNAEETLRLASDALQILYSTLNPATPGVAYTSSFLEEQWSLEKIFHANFNQRREDQRKKLGELLCLQDDLDEAWGRTTHTIAQAIARSNSCGNIADQIARHRLAIGADQIIGDLTRDQSDLLWKVWHSKTELRQRFLGLVEEKQPLFRVCRNGESTTLEGIKSWSLLYASGQTSSVHVWNPTLSELKRSSQHVHYNIHHHSLNTLTCFN
ncbi:hypothetical protein PtA15_18A171 [Puccinia triticina]|uniref:Uncharacterized protein n=1 Tax=Puccinia triticina TaxID=208348 RepID=A0ABY7D627_9BASI|nr:uncharacterized protein PtA15_18A171 [Puccinia triticina]WAQ93113.1 hypothetical protein PtA15_18A171 [Puccinia triticina]